MPVPKGSVWKVNLGWAIVIAGGIGSFVLARNSVQSQRQKNMKKQKAIHDEVIEEASKSQ